MVEPVAPAEKRPKSVWRGVLIAALAFVGAAVVGFLVMVVSMVRQDLYLKSDAHCRSVAGLPPSAAEPTLASDTDQAAFELAQSKWRVYYDCVKGEYK